MKLHEAPYGLKQKIESNLPTGSIFEEWEEYDKTHIKIWYWFNQRQFTARFKKQVITKNFISRIGKVIS